MVSEHLDFLNTSQDNCHQHYQNTTQEEGCQARERLEPIAAVLEGIVRKDTKNKNLSGIYCKSCDFKNLKLDEFDFTGAILVEAVFDGASLNNVSFKNANLSGAEFKKALLRGSNFEIDEPESYQRRKFRVGYRDLTLRGGPNFTCADLSGATFTRHPVFWVHSSEQQIFFADHSPLFWWANLTGTDFLYSAAYGVTNQDEGPFKVALYGYLINVPNGFFI